VKVQVTLPPGLTPTEAVEGMSTGILTVDRRVTTIMALAVSVRPLVASVPAMCRTTLTGPGGGLPAGAVRVTGIVAEEPGSRLV